MLASPAVDSNCNCNLHKFSVAVSCSFQLLLQLGSAATLVHRHEHLGEIDGYKTHDGWSL